MTTKKEIKTDLKFFSCKFDKELHDILSSDARANRRALSAHIIFICEQYVKSELDIILDIEKLALKQRQALKEKLNNRPNTDKAS